MHRSLWPFKLPHYCSVCKKTTFHFKVEEGLKFHYECQGPIGQFCGHKLYPQNNPPGTAETKCYEQSPSAPTTPTT